MTPDLRTRLEALTGQEPGRQPVPHRDPLPKVLARDEAQLAEVLQWAVRERQRVLPVGSGSRLGWGPPREADFALSTEALRGVVAHEAGDGTLTARAGTPLAELRDAARTSGHTIAPVSGRGTLGGALAAGDEGWQREGTGPARDHLLGARLALPDGRLVSSGGRLVKNVTGYDLHRLACGARGATGILVEGTLRLLPLPVRSARIRCGLANYAEAHGLALEHLRGTTPARRCEVALEGSHHVILTAWVGGSGAVVDALLDRLRSAGKRLLVNEGEAAEGATGEPTLTLTTRPSRLPATLARLEVQRLAGKGGVLARPLLGRVELRFERASFDPDEAEWLTRQALEADDRTLRAAWRDLPPELAAQTAVRLHASSRAASAGATLEARIRAALDPQGVLAR